MKSDTDVPDRLVRRTVDIARPHKIILFGSAARGEMKPGSDIDVLVVVPNGVHRRKTALIARIVT
jgi:predicted nucleotidyltransferase